jgi:hypothetical protein
MAVPHPRTVLPAAGLVQEAVLVTRHPPRVSCPTGRSGSCSSHKEQELLELQAKGANQRH